MAGEIAVENVRISNFEGLVTLTLDQVILHTVVHHSSSSTYMPNFIEIKGTFCGRTYRRTFETGIMRVDLIISTSYSTVNQGPKECAKLVIILCIPGSINNCFKAIIQVNLCWSTGVRQHP